MDEIKESDEVYIQRCERLIAFLRDELPERKGCSFDINNWLRQTHDCGTAGCVAGWAGQIPEFRASGLTSECVGGILVSGVVQYRENSGSRALADFLDLTNEQRNELCFEFSYNRVPVTAAMAAEKLQRFVQERKERAGSV